ncbi:MAG: GGDEF domain-containing protein [Xanthomonadales bacterium]|nr:GGDEF domain-containing protein [Xanthomonadales bacterium]
MPDLRQDSYTHFRDRLRWQVAVVLCALIVLLMAALAGVNVHHGILDNARLSAGIGFSAMIAGVVLWRMPHRLSGGFFFGLICTILVVAMAHGRYYGHPMQHWAYIFPPAIIFLLRARPSLAAMIGFGVYASTMIAGQVSGLDLIRFASGYGVLVCFMFTYALLQERAAAMLRYHSDHDALTNCLNRRTFNEALDALPARGGPVGLLLIDIDHFKAINDTHGHLIGDRAITEAAACLGRGLDAGTPLYRYGGEEFAVLVQLPLAGAQALAESLRAGVAAQPLAGLPMTVSIGIAEWAGAPESLASALARADAALYRAKREGRNRVVAG